MDRIFEGIDCRCYFPIPHFEGPHFEYAPNIKTGPVTIRQLPDPFIF